MTRSHTPGPWFIRADDTQASTVAVFARDMAREEFHVCQVNCSDTLASGGSGDDNARLIAAAPDLFNAVISLLDIVEFEYVEDSDPSELTSWKVAIDAANAAIAKAQR